MTRVLWRWVKEGKWGWQGRLHGAGPEQGRRSPLRLWCLDPTPCPAPACALPAVVPKESAHFGFFNGSRLLALREQPLYSEDWLGLRALDEAGRLLLLHAPGPHMQFSLDWFRQEVLLPYLAVPAQAAADDAAGRGPEAAGAAAAAAVNRKL